MTTTRKSIGVDLMSFDDEERNNNSNERRSVFDDSWNATSSAFVARNPEGGSSTAMMPSYSPQQPYLEYEQEDDLLLGLPKEPIMTDSGLLLTHRQSSFDAPSKVRRRTTSPPTTTSSPRIPMNYEHAAYMASQKSSAPRLSLSKVQRMFGLTKLMLFGLTTALVLGTMTIWHHSHHERKKQKQEVYVVPKSQQQAPTPKQQILLVPLNLTQSEVDRPPLGASHSNQRRHLKTVKDDLKFVKDEIVELEGDVTHAIDELRQEFEEWVQKHDKKYHSHDEKERRFHIWSQNHHETRRKNERHGPCQMTKKTVFGSNHFKDLTTEEFQARYLTGYNGPRTDKIPQQQPSTRRTATMTSDMVLDPFQRGDPRTAVDRHERVQEKYERHLNEQPSLSHFVESDKKEKRRSLQYGAQAAYSSSCRWYDVSCWIRWFVNTYGFGIGGTMEPAYDSDSYPSSIDWREMGAVSDVHSQGNCGACWAITAVETVESAYYIKKGTLYELAESEIILCDDSCEACNGGWPQNAYEYVMDHNGLPLENSYPYDGDTLYVFTEIRGGNEEYYEYYDTMGSYMSSYCPAGSGDNNNGGSRYGKIKGYGYATDRCVCYTDGTGCDCDDQNEKIALMNVATYGPATVCLEASTWQDYAGGIMTSDSGCSAAFLDMNHCVQAVGYAFVDSNEDGEDGDWNNNQQSGSGSGGSNKSGGSRDDGDRDGYWIIRNQWSEDWGMNGYAYVAMGENTCGVLNDMTQAYM